MSPGSETDNDKVDLMLHFQRLHQQMEAHLGVSRNLDLHGPSFGESTELCWLKFFEEYLPKRYCIDKAFVIDSHGDRSRQIDVVIFDRQYSPFLLNHFGSKIVPAESVYAVFEIKQELNLGYVREASEKIKSVTDLYRTSVPFVSNQGVQIPTEPKDIIGGILTTSTSWTSTLEERVEASLQTAAADYGYQIDLGCTLDRGAFEVLGKSPVDVRVSNPNIGLVAFLFILVEKLRKLGTVPAMDLESYSSGFWTNDSRPENE